MSLFKKATKSQSLLRLAITGPSGSGKTYTGLAIASVLADGKPIALVDTEHGSASKYAGIFSFDVAEMHPPFHPDKFIAAINEAQQAGYAVIILDSISHAWSGTGGVLDLVDEAAKRSKSGNTYMAWKEGTPVQNRMIDAIVQSGIHVIATMRSKTEYVLADTGNGKQAPRKVGMAPVQRDQFEYEFDVVFDMDVDNNAIVSKTRCPALTGRVFAKPGADVANVLRDWLSDGAPVANGHVKQAPPVQTPATEINHRQAPPPDDLPTTLDDLNELAPADEPSPDEAMRIKATEIIEAHNLKTPSHAWAWAVTNNYRSSEHSARTEWMQMITEQFGGVSLTPPKIKEAIVAYIELCLLNGKKEPVAA